MAVEDVVDGESALTVLFGEAAAVIRGGLRTSPSLDAFASSEAHWSALSVPSSSPSWFCLAFDGLAAVEDTADVTGSRGSGRILDTSMSSGLIWAG